jgi:L-lactate dehydrogenase
MMDSFASEEGSETMKIGIIGAGNVGAACLVSLIMRGVGREIVVVNRRRERAEGLVADARYGAPLSGPVALSAGTYSDLAGARLILITVGVNEKEGGATDRDDPEGRLRLLDQNATVYRDVVPKIVSAAPDAILLVVTDPPDPLADLARRLAGHDRVLSTGTFLDTLRFRVHIARHLDVAPMSVDAQVLGEHGTSQVFVWSSARVAGTPLNRLAMQAGQAGEAVRQRIEDEVRSANIAIIEGIGASQHGIGMAAARIAEAVLRDEKLAIPIGAYQEQYGVTLSLPAIIGRTGLVQILEPDLTHDERRALELCAEMLRQAVSRCVGGTRVAP